MDRTKSNVGALLTDNQLHEAMCRVHNTYMEALEMTKRAARKEALWKKYIKRHYKMNE